MRARPDGFGEGDLWMVGSETGEESRRYAGPTGRAVETVAHTLNC